MVNIGNDWDELLAEEFEKDYYLKLREFLKEEYATQSIHPDMFDLFNALKYTSYQDTRVVILGQDPYHGKGQAHGLSFSVREGVRTPPSLRNIFEEIRRELDIPIPNTGCLVPWAKQGVLLLNAVLTVREGKPNSHKGKGWEIFTDRVISLLNQREQPVVFLLWGRNAREKKSMIDAARHKVLECAHPSPMSADYGFFGCGHFAQTNEILQSWGQNPIDWKL